MQNCVIVSKNTHRTFGKDWLLGKHQRLVSVAAAELFKYIPH
jgi:hypothetical protein